MPASATTPDRTAPARPAPVAGSGSPTALSWAAVPGAATYEILADGTSIGTTTATSFVDPASADTTAPSIPTGVTVSTSTLGTATVRWFAATDSGHAATYTLRAIDADGNQSPLSAGTMLSSATGVASYRVLVDGSVASSTADTSLSVTGLAPGLLHLVRVVAVDGAGNQSAASPAVSVTVPTESISSTNLVLNASRLFARPGEAIRFTTQLDGAELPIQWLLSDGTSATGASLNHSFATGGRYEVQAMAVAANGTTLTASAQIVVDGGAPAISSSFTARGLSVVAADDASGIESVEWASAGGAWKSLVGGVIPLHEGTQRISIRVRDRAGNLFERTQTVTQDTTAPRIVIRAPRVTARGVVRVRLSVTDATTGVASLTVAGRRRSPRTRWLSVPTGRRVTVTAVDRNGNRSTATLMIPRVVTPAHAPSVAFTPASPYCAAPSGRCWWPPSSTWRRSDCCPPGPVPASATRAGSRPRSAGTSGAPALRRPE